MLLKTDNYPITCNSQDLQPPPHVALLYTWCIDHVPETKG